MVAEAFKKIWRAEKEPLEAISAERLAAFPLQASTREFLIKAGLPREAEPGFRFSRDVDDAFEGVSCLSDLYDLPGLVRGHYIVIGVVSGENPIAIDTQQGDVIVELSVEDGFKPLYVNGSIAQLAGCLVAYRDFVKNVNDARGEGAYLEANFTDSEFEELKQALEKIEPKMLEGQCFWNYQLEWELESRAMQQDDLLDDE